MLLRREIIVAAKVAHICFNMRRPGEFDISCNSKLFVTFINILNKVPSLESLLLSPLS